LKGDIQLFYKIKEFSSPLKVPEKINLKTKVLKPVVILGPGRSGTTLLFNLLNEHPSLVGTTEFPHGEATKVWVKYGGARMAGIGGIKSKCAIGHSHCLPMTEKDINEKRVKFLQSYFSNKYSRQLKNGNKLLNKNPHLSNKIGYLSKIFPDAHIIHMLRHPYSTIASWKVIIKQFPQLLFEIKPNLTGCMNIFPNNGWPIPSDENMEKLERLYFYNPDSESSIELLGSYWQNMHSNILRQFKIYSPKYYTCRYESLMENQNEELNKVVKFLAIPKKSKWEISVKPNLQHNWKDILSKTEIKIIRKKILDVSESFGYKL